MKEYRKKPVVKALAPTGKRDNYRFAVTHGLLSVHLDRSRPWFAIEVRFAK